MITDGRACRKARVDRAFPAIPVTDRDYQRFKGGPGGATSRAAARSPQCRQRSLLDANY